MNKVPFPANPKATFLSSETEVNSPKINFEPTPKFWSNFKDTPL